MNRMPVPIAALDSRIPEAGRIRLGVKTGNAMKSIDTFRFTSPDEDLITELGELYGGQCVPWNDPKANPPNQWQVITQAKEIAIYLPANSLSCWYEMWAGGGVQRRCDGEVCQIPQTTPGGWEMGSGPCVCASSGAMQCRPYTRLNVILPTIPFRGVWRLETKGWNAATELPGMVDIIDACAGAGVIVRATMYVERRVQQTPAGKRNFVVPGIKLAASMAEIIAGQADAKALSIGGNVNASVPVGALGSGLVSRPEPQPDDIIDADIIDDPLEDKVWEWAQFHHIDPHDLWQGFLLVANGDKTRLIDGIARLEAGTITPIGFNPNGTIIWKRQP